MICKPCRAAGVLNREGVKLKSVQLSRQAEFWHTQCDNKCDCQHVVGRTARAGKEPK